MVPFSQLLLTILLLSGSHLFGEDNQPTPILMIHGGGPAFMVTMKKMKQFFVDEGHSSKRIHLLNYNYRGSVESMSLDLKKQIEVIKARYSRDQKFDLVTHSLGNFVGMHAIATGGNAKIVRKYIGLAGVAFGQNAIPTYCKILGCPKYMKQLAPYKNSYIVDFWNSHSSDILGWDHCALYSYEDKRVNEPFDSGVVKPGTGYVVEGVSHLGFVKNRKGTELVLDHCYGGNLN
jgi:pimeloyl-ACP methyl ester carboxylesterase